MNELQEICHDKRPCRQLAPLNTQSPDMEPTDQTTNQPTNQPNHENLQSNSLSVRNVKLVACVCVCVCVCVNVQLWNRLTHTRHDRGHPTLQIFNTVPPILPTHRAP